jgi:hypothetical protein
MNWYPKLSDWQKNKNKPHWEQGRREPEGPAKVLLQR